MLQSAQPSAGGTACIYSNEIIYPLTTLQLEKYLQTSQSADTQASLMQTALRLSKHLPCLKPRLLLRRVKGRNTLAVAVPSDWRTVRLLGSLSYGGSSALKASSLRYATPLVVQTDGRLRRWRATHCLSSHGAPIILRRQIVPCSAYSAEQSSHDCSAHVVNHACSAV
jgi:hypothetical protein